MHRANICFSQETWEDLKRFVVAKYGVKKALSITVEEAVKEYLKRRELLEQLAR